MPDKNSDRMPGWFKAGVAVAVAAQLAFWVILLYAGFLVLRNAGLL